MDNEMYRLLDHLCGDDPYADTIFEGLFYSQVNDQPIPVRPVTVWSFDEGEDVERLALANQDVLDRHSAAKTRIENPLIVDDDEDELPFAA